MRVPLFVQFLVLVVGTAAATTVLSDAKPAPTQLGFVDVRKAFDTYRKHQDVMDQLKKKNDDFVKQLKQLAAEIDKQSDRLNTMNSGAPDYAQLDKEIAVAKGTIDVEKKFKLRELESEQRKKNAAIYKEICDEAQSYGAEHGLAAVMLYLPPDADLDQNFDMVALTRAVLCRDDQLDVTTEIVSRLNAQLPPPSAAPKSPAAPDPKQPPK